MRINDLEVLQLILSKVEGYNNCVTDYGGGFKREPLTADEFRKICLAGHMFGIKGYDVKKEWLE